MDRHRGHRVRVRLVSGFILALFVGLLGRLALIQGVQAPRYRGLAEGQYRVTVPLRVRRGTVADCRGRELAVSTQAPSVFANARLIRDKALTAQRLAELLGVDGRALRERLERRSEEACVRERLSAADVAALRQAKLLDLPHRPLEVRESRPGEWALFVRPAAVVAPEELAKKLSPILRRDWRDVQQDLEAYQAFTWIDRKVTDEEARRVRSQIAEERHRRLLHVAAEQRRWQAELKLPRGQCHPIVPPPVPSLAGIGVIPEYRRSYVHGSVAPQLLGFVGIDDNGLEGLELVLDETLGGRPGEVTFQRDATGDYISALETRQVEPVPGADVELSLDAVIQSYAESALDEAMALWVPSWAAAVVVDVRTGDVLAAACRPSLEPDKATDYAPETLKKLARARYIVDWLEPGSIMKPFVLSAALSEGLVTEQTVILCENGVWTLGSRRFHDHHAYGNLTAVEVIVKSSNIGAAKLGMRLGPQKLHRYLAGFGFGQPTGFPLKGENPGMLRPWQEWRPNYSLPSICVGQEICVNMVQMSLAFASIANGGLLMKPRVVRRVFHAEGRVEERPPQVVRRIIPSRVAEQMRGILCRAVEEGTGKAARSDLYSLGGKTGTAEKPLPNGGFSHDKLICSFVAMAPVENPRIVVMVSVDEPTKKAGGQHFGGTVAAPAVGQIINQTLAYLGVPPDRTQTLARLGIPGECMRTN